MRFAKRGLAGKASVNDTVMKINSFTAGQEEPKGSWLVSGVLISFWLQPRAGLGEIMRTKSLMSIISLHDDTAVLCREVPLLFVVSLLINSPVWKCSAAFKLVLCQL